MEKILLLNPPGKRRYLRDQYCSSSAKADYYWPAVDLLVLSGVLNRDFSVKVIDAIVERYNDNDVQNIIKKDSYSALISLSSTASKDEDFELFRKIKQACELKIIVSGGFLRLAPQKYLLQYDFIDAVITDYTQDGIIGFLNGSNEKLPGLYYKNSSKIIGCDFENEESEFSLACARHELFPLRKYCLPQAKKTPFTCMIISGGCPFGCRFCSSSSIPFRKRALDNCMEELLYIKKLGIEEVHFPDFTFTADRKHALNVCLAMIKEKIGISWDCLTRVDCFDEELAVVMKKAGCHTIQFGVETKNEKILRDLAKPLSNRIVRRAFDLCKKNGIETIGFFIVGLPGEDALGVKENIKFARELDCDYASFSVFVPDFGSLARKDLIAANTPLDEVYNFDRTKFPIIGNGVLSRQEIWSLRNKSIRGFYFNFRYLTKQLKKINSWSKLKVSGRVFWSMIKDFFVDR